MLQYIGRSTAVVPEITPLTGDEFTIGRDAKVRQRGMEAALTATAARLRGCQLRAELMSVRLVLHCVSFAAVFAGAGLAGITAHDLARARQTVQDAAAISRTRRQSAQRQSGGGTHSQSHAAAAASCCVTAVCSASAVRAALAADG